MHVIDVICRVRHAVEIFASFHILLIIFDSLLQRPQLIPADFVKVSHIYDVVHWLKRKKTEHCCLLSWAYFISIVYSQPFQPLGPTVTGWVPEDLQRDWPALTISFANIPGQFLSQRMTETITWRMSSAGEVWEDGRCWRDYHSGAILRQPNTEMCLWISCQQLLFLTIL